MDIQVPQIESRTDNLVEYAAAYAEMGFIPIPVQATGKIPSISAWQKQPPGVQAAKDRLSDHQGNIGLTFPDDLFALDVDAPQGDASLQALIDKHGDLPQTLTQETPSGGWHHVFRKPLALVLKNTCSALGEGLDIRAQGGQIVAEPSTINGNDYGWIDWEVLGGEKPEIADAPEWLLKLISKPADPRVDTTKAKRGAGDHRDNVIHEGERNKRLFKIAAAMRGHGNCEDAILAQLRHVNSTRCNPPLSDFEIEKIVKSAANFPEGGEPEATEWPELVPLEDDEPLAEMPEEALENWPRWLADMVIETSRSHETPLELAASIALSCISVATSRVLRVKEKEGHYEHTNIWILCAMESGNRKSSVMNMLKEPLSTWESNQSKAMEATIDEKKIEREAKESAIKRLQDEYSTAAAKGAKAGHAGEAKNILAKIKKLKSELPIVPVAPRLFTSDTTTERLGSLLKENHERFAWLSDEGGLISIWAGRYSNGFTNIDLILKSHRGESDSTDRVSRESIILNNPVMVFGVCPQPIILEELAKHKEFRQRGLSARFIYFIPKSRLGYRKKNQPAVGLHIRESYSNRLMSMLDWKDPKGKGLRRYTINITNEAKEVFDEFWEEIEKKMKRGGPFSQVTDWASKLSDQALRIAGILHAAKFAHANKDDDDSPWEVEISKETMETAILFVTYSIPHCRRALDIIGTDPPTPVSNAKRLLNWIVRENEETFRVRDAFSALKHVFPTMEHIHEARKVLEERGYTKELRPDDQRKKRRGRPPSPTILVRREVL